MTARCIDQATGQVYTEVMMAPAIGFLNGPAWVDESPFLPVVKSSSSGTPTLKDLAIKRALRDQRRLMPSHFENVPWPIAEYLWDYLYGCKRRTTYMWKLFATAYPAEFREVAPHWPMVIERPKMLLKKYLNLIQNVALRWGVVLTLSTEFARTPEFVEVANLHNICALEVSTTSHTQISPGGDDVQVPALSDRIVRTWSELVQTSSAFRHLRILRLYGQQDLTRVVFTYFRFFPSLKVIVAVGCGKMVTESAKDLAATYGWGVENRRQHEECDGETEWFDELETAYQCYRASLDDSRWMKPAASLGQDLPILDCQIGSRYTKTRQSKATVFLREYLETNLTAVAIKRRKRAGLVGDHESEPRSKVRKPVLKNILGKDLTGLLAEFS